MSLDKTITLLEQKIAHFDAVNLNVSSKGIDWHFDHSLKVINGVILSLKKSNPAEYQWKFNATRIFFLTKGSFPRGKAKAPKSVVNNENIMIDDVLTQLKTAKTLVSELNLLHPKSNFKHPYFGSLNLRMSKRFLKIHTHHHLKIMDDIIKQ
jgi:hypothetical protein